MKQLLPVLKRHLVIQNEINTVSYGNIASVYKMKIIFISSYKDTLIGSKILVGKMEMIIISFFKVSLVIKMHSAIFLIMLSATFLWSVKWKYLSVSEKISWSVIL